MGFTAGEIKAPNTEKIKEKVLSPNQLSAGEIEALLSIIKNTTFLGKDIEPLYHTIIKLQNQYLEITKQ